MTAWIGCRSWRGDLYHCAVCCRTFADMAAHGAHVGPGGCRSAGELATRGLVVVGGVWAWLRT